MEIRESRSGVTIELTKEQAQELSEQLDLIIGMKDEPETLLERLTVLMVNRLEEIR